MEITTHGIIESDIRRISVFHRQRDLSIPRKAEQWNLRKKEAH